MYFLNPILKGLVRFQVTAAKPRVLILFKKAIPSYFVRFWVIFYVRVCLCGSYSPHKKYFLVVLRKLFIAICEICEVLRDFFMHFLLYGSYPPHKNRLECTMSCGRILLLKAVDIIMLWKLCNIFSSCINKKN